MNIFGELRNIGGAGSTVFEEKYTKEEIEWVFK